MIATVEALVLRAISVLLAPCKALFEGLCWPSRRRVGERRGALDIRGPRFQRCNVLSGRRLTGCHLIDVMAQAPPRSI
jgi:hypothetical protein